MKLTILNLGIIYEEFGFSKGDIYIVDYKLLNRFILNVWNNLLKGEDSKKNEESKYDSDSEDGLLKMKCNLYLKIRMNLNK